MESKSHKAAQLLELITAAFLFFFAVGQPLSIAAAHVAYAGAALVWLARLLVAPRRRLYSSPLDLPILFYLVLCALSAAMSPLPASSWEGMRKVALVFLVVVVAQNVISLPRVKQLVTVLFVSGLVTVAWAGWQYTEGIGLRAHQPGVDTALYRAGLRDDDAILRVDGWLLRQPGQFLAHLSTKPLTESLQLRVVHGGGIAVLKDAVPVVVPAGEWLRADHVEQLGTTLDTARPDRAQAFYSHYVTYSMVLELMASVAFGLWLGLWHRSPVASWIFAAIFLALALGLGMTLTRAAWLALAFGCVVQAWFHLRRSPLRWLLPVFLLVAVIGTSAAMYHWRGIGLIDLNDAGSDYRVLMWRDGIRIIGQHPWFGVGMNSVRDAPDQFDLAAYKKYSLRSHFHSTPIQIGVESGIPALLSWIVLMACYWWMLVKLVARAREQGNSFAYGLALGILGGTTGFLASSPVHYDFGDSVVVFLFWFLAGLAVALRQQLRAGTPA